MRSWILGIVRIYIWSFMKIGGGFSELWGEGRKSPSPLTRPMVYITFLCASSPGPQITSLDTSSRPIRHYTSFWLMKCILEIDEIYNLTLFTPQIPSPKNVKIGTLSWRSVENCRHKGLKWTPLLAHRNYLAFLTAIWNKIRSIVWPKMVGNRPHDGHVDFNFYH